VKPLYTPETKKIIFFDMNHTLIDEHKTLEHCFATALQEFTARWEADGGKLDAGKMYRTYQEEWRSKPAAKTAQQISARRHQALSRALEPIPLAVTEAFSRSFFAKIKDLKSAQPQLYRDADATLRKLADRYKLAILSNGSPERLDVQLRSTGLDELILGPLRFAAAKGEPRKPNPAMFQRALQKSGVSPMDAIMVGNSWKNDIFGATRSGLDAIWFHPSHSQKWTQKRIGKEQITVIRKIRELQNIFG
jgi:putative hydrolase of the HAD superfamily